MNIIPISITNTYKNQNFGAKISAPEDFWREVTSAKLSEKKSELVKWALSTIRDLHGDEVLSLSKESEKKLVKTHTTYSAEAIKANLNVAFQKGGTWVDFLAKTADRFANDFAEMRNLVKEVKSNE